MMLKLTRSLAFPLLCCLAIIGLSCSQPVQTTQAPAEVAEILPAPEPAEPLEFFFADKQSFHHNDDGTLKVAVTDTTSQAIPIRALSVEEQQARFVLPPGYRLEPVLTEPEIREPAAIAFDGNGRMFVLELRTYMQDIDATAELEPLSRISMHEDLDDDGVYETHHVFVDSLIFPRFVMPFGINSILSMESNEDEVYQYTDTDGDGRADEKTLFTTNYGKSGNVEHQQAFLYWGMDNWMYSTYNAFRIRWTPDGILREPTGSNRAQWGVTQDDAGKIWFQGGASGLPSYFQFPIVYGNFDIDEPYAEGFREPYGIAGVGDYQPGPRASREDGTLNQVTGSAGNDVVRGHRLPDDLKGHYIYGEPVGRIVRRVEPVITDGLTTLHNVYQEEESEFIRSHDPLFRPVDMATAPDGSLYIVDMYRGIIQQGNWVQEGTFLRAKVEQYEIDKVFGNGRIWRLTHDSIERDKTKPQMHSETPAQWVSHLTHPNGMWRDAAQQLLILEQDKSVVPALKEMALSPSNKLARFHALWTLEGLDCLEADFVRVLLEDADPEIRIQAMRASETLYKTGDRSFAQDYQTLANDSDENVAIQAMLSLKVLDPPNKTEAIQQAMAANTSAGIQFVGDKILNPPTFGRGSNGSAYTVAEQERLQQGATIFNELCAQCHGNNGMGTPAGDGLMAPRLINSPRVQQHSDYIVKTLLHGLKGPINGNSYPGDLMIGMEEQSDEWIAAVASFVRAELSNDASLVTPEQVARVRAQTKEQETPYTYDELTASIPSALTFDRDTWKVSASHVNDTRVGGTAAAMGAFSFEGWSTGESQQPGMWFQIEFPNPVTLAQINFVSPLHRRGWGQDAPPPLETYPRNYNIETSMNGVDWESSSFDGNMSATSLTIDLEPAEVKFVRITQTGETEAPWSMREMKLLGFSD